MKWIFVFIYWLVTWIIKYIINFFELIWHLDTSYLSSYGFLTIKEIKECDPVLIISEDELNSIERFIYWCVV